MTRLAVSPRLAVAMGMGYFVGISLLGAALLTIAMGSP